MSKESLEPFQQLSLKPSAFSKIQDCKIYSSHLQNLSTVSFTKLLTTKLLSLYYSINSEFDYQSLSNPRRVLTKVSKPAHNEGYDNEDYDYILHVNDILGSQEGQRYFK